MEDNRVAENNESHTARDLWYAKTYGIGASEPGNKGSGKKRTGLIVFGIIIAVIALIAIGAKVLGFGPNDDDDLSGAAGINEKYIGVLYVEGEISSDGDTYNHDYALSAIDGMMENDDNKALILYVETPGGGVYESDELYLKIREYKETTGRPVCAYFGSQATSGGYYISAPADRIIANRNCWTGSIGVTIGNLYDISELLAKYGIKSTNISSGDNKSMGDITVPLTDEQKQIFQSLVDEAYDQFVGVVAEGRSLDVSYVKQISDGRIYTAEQARELKLLDSVVNTYDEAVAEMTEEFDLGDYEIYEFRYEPQYDFLSSLIISIQELADASSQSGDIKALTELMENSNSMPLQYICEVTK